MATKKVTRSKSQGKTAARARRPKQEAGPLLGTAPDPFCLTGAAFDGGEALRPDCTAADLFSLVFDAPNAGGDILEQLLGCMSDEFELLRVAAISGSSIDDVMERVCNRNCYRIKVGLEVHQRMTQARDSGGKLPTARAEVQR